MKHPGLNGVILLLVGIGIASSQKVSYFSSCPWQYGSDDNFNFKQFAYTTTSTKLEGRTYYEIEKYREYLDGFSSKCNRLVFDDVPGSEVQTNVFGKPSANFSKISNGRSSEETRKCNGEMTVPNLGYPNRMHVTYFRGPNCNVRPLVSSLTSPQTQNFMVLKYRPEMNYVIYYNCRQYAATPSIVFLKFETAILYGTKPTLTPEEFEDARHQMAQLGIHEDDMLAVRQNCYGQREELANNGGGAATSRPGPPESSFDDIRPNSVDNEVK